MGCRIRQPFLNQVQTVSFTHCYQRENAYELCNLFQELYNTFDLADNHLCIDCCWYPTALVSKNNI
jgi:hypothetical protein